MLRRRVRSSVSTDGRVWLFEAVVESTEEAIYNSILKATTVTGMGNTAEALPIAETTEVLRRFNVIR